ncbi:uncharacterized protein LOC131026828 [Cryptomeria japonica]|uniref:uncharacterized protein LOC131026828 n=1 Tax=Cryptomeria japonica TaxID=3369 RepID=UPI0027DA2989|nr:uncharacterized protein LOC131026828 [Cryptomeria japonica]
MATVFCTFSKAISSVPAVRSWASLDQQWIHPEPIARRYGKSVCTNAYKCSKIKTNASTKIRSSPSSNNFNRPVAAANPTIPVSKSFYNSLDYFIPQFVSFIQAKRELIETAKKNKRYRPFSEEWTESFYHMKGQHTRATCFSQDQIPTLLKNIVNSDCRRDFVLYKDIPTVVLISDFEQNFGIKESLEAEHLEYEPIPLSHDASLPKGYQSVLLEEDESLPRGYHIILDSPFLRIFSHVTVRELFQSWRLDPQEQEKQVKAMYRRNKWPFTEKVE